MRILLIPLVFFLSAFTFVPPHANLAAPGPVFHAEQFFAGRTEGKGTVKIALARRTPVSVTGIGRTEADGTLVLDQRIERPGKPVQTKQWRIRKVGSGRYSGTLTGARGAVTGEVKGNCLHLRYRLVRHGYLAEQFIYLQPGGRSALNRMTIRKFGVPVATVEETIRRVG